MRKEGGSSVARIRIMFSRFSAFYSPLIAAQAAGFLKAAGLDAEFSVASAGVSPQAGLRDGSLDLIQSAVSSSFPLLERDEALDLVHFAQINQRDGFFIAARSPDTAFTWAKLAGARVLVDHGAQPLAMFKYALHRRGVDYGALSAVDAGSPEAMQTAFRGGEGEYVHLQGPAPQQLEADGVGHVVASVGEAIGPVAFSSLCAHRDFMATERARAFTGAFAQARAWVQETPAARVAETEAGYFKEVDPEVLTRTIAAYQRLGCWDGPLAIPRDAYEISLDVFEYSGLITRRHPYDAVVTAPPPF
jgi:NitT/TauT family transport system substrate-binding protein